MMTDVFTQTLTSGQVLTVSTSADFGELLITMALLAAVVMVILDFMQWLLYER